MKLDIFIQEVNEMIQSDQQKTTFNNEQTQLIPRKIFPKI